MVMDGELRYFELCVHVNLGIGIDHQVARRALDVAQPRRRCHLLLIVALENDRIPVALNNLPDILEESRVVTLTRTELFRESRNRPGSDKSGLADEGGELLLCYTSHDQPILEEDSRFRLRPQDPLELRVGPHPPVH